MPTLNTFQRVYEAARKIPYGRVTTYGQIACLLGNPRMSRVVGYALHACKESDRVPWHRIVNRQGVLSAETAEPGGGSLQRALLEAEGVTFLPDGTVDMRCFMWYGDPDESL